MKKKILFIYTNYSSFVKTDFEILASENEVTQYQYKPVKGMSGNVIQILKQLFFLVLNIWKFDAVFIWFADYHSFLPVLFAKILGKKSFVVIGGYDVANIPELRYGSLSTPFRKTITLFTYKYAALCLPVVESLESKLKELCPSAKTKTIYTGYKLEKQTSLEQEREKIILTVSITDSQQRILIKGLDRFKELAEHLPDYQFYIVGVKEVVRNLFEPVPQNLFILPSLSQSELIVYYKKASFYAQFSRSEGLPNALCEGMLYGCIPLGTHVGGIPTAIGKLGLILNEWDTKTAIEFIEKKHNAVNRENISNHILKNFSIEFRKFHLIQLLLNLQKQIE
jgi:glycosyltransferase involved in cell wall biosynthesis